MLSNPLVTYSQLGLVLAALLLAAPAFANGVPTALADQADHLGRTFTVDGWSEGRAEEEESRSSGPPGRRQLS